MSDRLLAWLMWSMAGFFALLTVLLLVVYVPASMYAERQCLRAGYPKASVTFDLETYCLTIDGQTRAVVIKR